MEWLTKSMFSSSTVDVDEISNNTDISSDRESQNIAEDADDIIAQFQTDTVIVSTATASTDTQQSEDTQSEDSHQHAKPLLEEEMEAENDIWREFFVRVMHSERTFRLPFAELGGKFTKKVLLKGLLEHYACATGLKYYDIDDSGQRVEKRIRTEISHDNRVFLLPPEDDPHWKTKDYHVEFRVDPDVGLPVGLCLSGGGFRATVFHVGALRRLNELGILRHVDTISSVSGGSITNAILALGWTKLMEHNFSAAAFDEYVQKPVFEMCNWNIALSVIVGNMNPYKWYRKYSENATSTTFLAEHYEKINPDFKKPLAEAIPQPRSATEGGVPLFVFCACDMRDGSPFYFTCNTVGHSLTPKSRADIKRNTWNVNAKHQMSKEVCEELARTVTISQAVACSSSYPLIFEPFLISVPYECDAEFGKHSGTDSVKEQQHEECIELQEQESTSLRGRFRKRISIHKHEHPHYSIPITDGGIYDNLGLDPLVHPCPHLPHPHGDQQQHQVILVSDAGAPLPYTENPSVEFTTLRSYDIIYDQIGRLRSKIFLSAFKNFHYYGTWWRLETVSQTVKRLLSQHKQHHAEGGDCEMSKTVEEIMQELEGRGFPKPEGDEMFLFSETALKYITSFRTDLNRLTEMEKQVLENTGYVTCAYQFHKYCNPFFMEKINQKERFSLQHTFLWPHPNVAQSQIIENVLKSSASVIQANLVRPIFDLWTGRPKAALPPPSPLPDHVALRHPHKRVSIIEDRVTVDDSDEQREDKEIEIGWLLLD